MIRPRRKSLLTRRPPDELTVSWLTMFVIGSDLFVVSPLLPLIVADYGCSAIPAGLSDACCRAIASSLSPSSAITVLLRRGGCASTGGPADAASARKSMLSALLPGTLLPFERAEASGIRLANSESQCLFLDRGLLAYLEIRSEGLEMG